MAKPERLDDVLPYIVAADFYRPEHQVIFGAILSLLESQSTIDIVSLASALQSSGQIEQAGGSTYLASLLENFPLAVNAEAWARTVRDMSRRRQVMQACVELWQASANPAANVSEVTAEFSDLVDSVLANRLDTGRQTPRQIVADYREWLDAAMDEYAGVPLPFARAQELTGGFMPGEMIVLAARPSNGKTALMLNMCIYALSAGARVGIVSLEMRSRDLMSRMAAMSLDINAQKFRNRQLTPEDRAAILGFCGRFEQLPLRMWDEPEFSPSRMRAVVKAWKRQLGGLDFLVIDYLQLLESDQAEGRMSYTREQEVARISKAIKRLALREELPVMILAQLNRQAEKDAKPMLSHLRESGSLEQDADFVLFLSFWDPRTPGDEVDIDLDIAKGRSSQTGTVPVTYFRKYLRFEARMQGGGF
jgi:replicative DNA helicase